MELSELSDEALSAELSEAIEEREAARERVRVLGAERARREAENPVEPDPDAQVVRLGG